MTYEEAGNALFANTTVEDMRKLWCELFTDIRYLNYLVEKMGLTVGKREKNQFQNAVAILNDNGETIGQIIPVRKSIMFFKQKNVKYLEMLQNETYVLTGNNCKAHMLNFHKFYKKTNYIVKLGTAWCIYTSTPPFREDIISLVNDMITE